MSVTYERIIASLPDGVAVLDTQNRVLVLNPAASRYATLDDERSIGKGVEAVFPWLVNVLAPLERLEEIITEVNFRDKVVELRTSPLLDARGRRRGRLLIFHDITGRKQIEFELSQHVEQLAILRQVVEEISDTLNIDAVMSMALDAALRLSGGEAGFIALDENGTMRVNTLIGPYPADFAQKPLERAGAIGQALTNRRPQLTFKDRDAGFAAPLVKTRAQMALPLLLQDRFVGLLNLETAKSERFDEGVFQFIQILADRIVVAVENARLYRHVREQLDELQKLYEQVSQLEQLKTDMIRIAAHDLRSPISAMTGYVQMLDLDRDQLSDMHREYVGNMLNSLNRMTRMVEDILSLERIEQMAQSDSGRTFNLRTLVERACADYRPRAEQKRQQFTVQITDDIGAMTHGDSAQIFEAITNLIGNAIKYTPEGGAIAVRLGMDDDDRLTFEVVDNGYGIPEAMQARLFQPFYRAVTEETQSISGTGLGLHLVKNIIERHKGRMIFKSSYGSGSTFGFRLPALPIGIDSARQRSADQ